jgi:hypothetical protein
MAPTKQKQDNADNQQIYAGRQVTYEFGGPIGAGALMIWSHLNLIYFW